MADCDCCGQDWYQGGAQPIQPKCQTCIRYSSFTAALEQETAARVSLIESAVQFHKRFHEKQAKKRKAVRHG